MAPPSPGCRSEASQDRSNALGQRSGECPLCPGRVGPYPDWSPEQVKARDGGEAQLHPLGRSDEGWRGGRPSSLLARAHRRRSARSRGRRCGGPSGRRLRRLLEPGCSAAPGRHCLALLPSGPDAVRRLPMRGTWLSTLRAPAQTPDDSAPRAVLGPAIADCGRREPLAPRLARPGEKIVATSSACPRSGPSRFSSPPRLTWRPRFAHARPDTGRRHPERKAKRAREEWARLGSNQRPLACEASALPLSYAPGIGAYRSHRAIIGRYSRTAICGSPGLTRWK